jgi:hypothetical protein
MSTVLLSADVSFDVTGTFTILPVANYVITDITIILSNFDVVNIGAFSFESQLESIGSITMPFQQIRLVGEVTVAGTAVNSNQVIQRSFASALILPRQANISINISSFVNLNGSAVTFDLSGFTY